MIARAPWENNSGLDSNISPCFFLLWQQTTYGFFFFALLLIFMPATHRTFCSYLAFQRSAAHNNRMCRNKYSLFLCTFLVFVLYLNRQQQKQDFKPSDTWCLWSWSCWLRVSGEMSTRTWQETTHQVKTSGWWDILSTLLIKAPVVMVTFCFFYG